MHEHVVAALQAGAQWQVEFLPFSLTQTHVEEGFPPVWDDPSQQPGLWAVSAALVIKELYPDDFYRAHLAFFSARHDEARNLSDKAVLLDVMKESGLDGESVFKEIDQGWPIDKFRIQHEESVETFQAFGVPTFFVGETATFVRIMTRPEGGYQNSEQIINAILETIIEHPEVNEVKRTTIPN